MIRRINAAELQFIGMQHFVARRASSTVTGASPVGDSSVHATAQGQALLKAAASTGAAGLKAATTTPSPQEDVFASFNASVSARTVGNHALRKYIQQRATNEIELVDAAIAGSKHAGLKIDAKTSELYLQRLVQGGKLKAALEWYNGMTAERVTPTAQAYNILMRLCMERDMSSSVQTLFDDMNKRGRSPDHESYELVITAMSAECPPKWEKAIQVFDKITRDRTNRVTARTYNALMRVYLNMSPFDWRIVYNCYYELRQLHPKVQLTWESYELVREAFLKGRAGRFRRIVTFVDAWFVLTHIKTLEFWGGVFIFVAVMMSIKGFLGFCLTRWTGGFESAQKAVTDSVLPTY